MNKLKTFDSSYFISKSHFEEDGTQNYLVFQSEIVATPLWLREILKDWSTDNMKKTGFNRYVYDFSVDHDGSDVDDIKDIHKYLMKKIT